MSDVVALEGQLEQAKRAMELRDRAQRLARNPDFKKLILDEFCVKDAARYVQTSCDPALGENERADALAIAQASGHLRRWLSVTIQIGNACENQMGDLDEALAEARQEELEDEQNSTAEIGETE